MAIDHGYLAIVSRRDLCNPDLVSDARLENCD